MIVARVRRTLRERGQLVGGESVLVACSGGPDSAVLLHLLAQLAGELSLTVHAASVDHGLRADAGRDVAVARELADRLGVPFAALRVTVGAAGPSIQAKAREARYRALLDEAAARRCSHLAVGHTLDDQAETVLARVLRGSGVHGLRGIEPRRDDRVIRPLIDCRRADVHAHAARYALPVITDPSNADSRYLRVRVRRELMPILAREDPRVAEHLAQLADEARELDAWVAEAARGLLDRSHDDRGLRVGPLLEAPAPVRTRALARWVASITGSAAKRSHLDALADALEGRGEPLLPGGWIVSRVDDCLVARRPTYVRSRSVR